MDVTSDMPWISKTSVLQWTTVDIHVTKMMEMDRSEDADAFQIKRKSESEGLDTWLKNKESLTADDRNS